MSVTTALNLPNNIKAAGRACARKAAWIAVEPINIDSTAHVVIVRRPRLRTHSLFIVDELFNVKLAESAKKMRPESKYRNDDTSISESRLDLLHVNNKGIRGRICRLLELIFDLIQNDRLGQRPTLAMTALKYQDEKEGEGEFLILHPHS